MIKHIVLFKLKNFAEGRSKAENADYIKSLLETLPSKIEIIKKLEIGINFSESERAFDMSLYSEFETKEDLIIYMKHPEHCKIADYIQKVREQSYMVDYEF